MRRYLLIAVGFAILASFSLTQPAQGQVYSEFAELTDFSATWTSYSPLGIDARITEPNMFALPPNFVDTLNTDNGYYKEKIDLGFDFEFNGTVYDAIWVNVNGFACFTEDGEFPPNVAPDFQKALFNDANSYPTNVLAPFWGDHYLRTEDDVLNGFVESQILFETYYDANEQTDVFVVEWRNLNINYMSPQNDILKNSIANFQLRIYKSKAQQSAQGDIEFAYGPVGGNNNANPQTINTKGATVGMKGHGDDFINGLLFESSANEQRSDTTITNLWPPSGGTDIRIRFNARIRPTIEYWWGDGDADMSKAPTGYHKEFNYGADYHRGQNRYVTVNDVRVIMRSIAQGIPLDSVRYREAYHGDVNHNGRFFWGTDPQSNEPMIVEMTWRDEDYLDNWANGLTDPRDLYFRANEHDAAWILNYMAARIPTLPWIYDTVVRYGKIGIDERDAFNLRFGQPVAYENGTFRVPVFLDGKIDGPVSGKFNVNGIVSSADGEISPMTYENRVVFSDAGEFDGDNPIFTIEVATEDDVLELSDIRFNDMDKQDRSIRLITETADDSEILSSWPNPFRTNTSITLNVPNDGNYILAVYDMAGNRVKTIANGNLAAGQIDLDWNGTNDIGLPVQSGVYVIRLVSDNVSVSEKVILNR